MWSSSFLLNLFLLRMHSDCSHIFLMVNYLFWAFRVFCVAFDLVVLLLDSKCLVMFFGFIGLASSSDLCIVCLRLFLVLILKTISKGLTKVFWIMDIAFQRYFKDNVHWCLRCIFKFLFSFFDFITFMSNCNMTMKMLPQRVGYIFLLLQPGCRSDAMWCFCLFFLMHLRPSTMVWGSSSNLWKGSCKEECGPSAAHVCEPS